MLPLITHNTQIIVDFSVKKYVLGDIVVLYDIKNRYFLAHRIIFLSNNSALIKGDNNPYADGYIPMKFFFGRVVALQSNRQLVCLTTSFARIGQLRFVCISWFQLVNNHLKSVALILKNILGRINRKMRGVSSRIRSVT